MHSWYNRYKVKNILIGENIKQVEGFDAFIPYPFPPKSGFDFDKKILKKNDEAIRLLGKLDGINKLLPDADFFLLMYLRKDATSSSQIEGTQATMIDAIEAEANINPNHAPDVNDILHYINALNYGLERVTKDNFPVTLRFIRELHKELMDQARASHFSDPGEFRKSQNWIGGTNPSNARFVPPPIDAMHTALNDLENFIHTDDCTLTLIKAALIHAQFETIHPFLDGNGRTGRMLITFFLWKEKVLEKPVLFLSSYFKKHQQLYYEKLFGYHNDKVADWVEFFLDGIIEIANEAINTIEKIADLREQDILKIQKLSTRASESAAIVLPKLYAQPIVNVATIEGWTGFTKAGAQRVVNKFVEMDILVPRKQEKKYDQIYAYETYLNIFRE